MSDFSFEPKTGTFSLINADILAQAAKLAYASATDIGKTVEQQWKFSKWHFFNNAGTQGFVANKADMILLAFRGTEVKEKADIIADIKIALEPGPVGEVHHGFHDALQAIWPDVDARLTEYWADDPAKPLWITGHSLGAALATLATARVIFNRQNAVQGLYTFGCPRVGNEDFALAFDARIMGQTFRFVNNNDVVTRVPLAGKLLPYRHVGTLKYFDADGRLHNKMGWWKTFLDRLKGHVDDLGNHGTDGMKDHSMAGYVDLVHAALTTNQ